MCFVAVAMKADHAGCKSVAKHWHLALHGSARAAGRTSFPTVPVRCLVVGMALTPCDSSETVTQICSERKDQLLMLASLHVDASAVTLSDNASPWNEHVKSSAQYWTAADWTLVRESGAENRMRCSYNLAGPLSCAVAERWAHLSNFVVYLIGEEEVEVPWCHELEVAA